MPKTTIVVPCYNEEKRLDASAFRAFLGDHEDVGFLFVNDGSADSTADLLDDLSRSDAGRLGVLHLERNGGKAEAVRLGLLESARLGADYAGFWDADLATPLEAIPDFTDVLDAHPDVLMVFGARVRLLGRKIERRPVRHYLGRIFATVVSLMLRVPVYDTQCGAKLFRMCPETLRLFEVPFRSRWIFDVEILAKFLSLHRSAGTDVESLIHEVPLHRWRDVAGSKVRSRDFVRAAFELWTVRQAYCRGTPSASAPVIPKAAEVAAS
jgi:glycosyltransferase involved in cell wall biosynthesis